MTPRLLRASEVSRKTGLSRDTIDRLEADGKFPRRASLFGKTVAWAEDEVDAWIAERLRAREGKAA
jgi:prophage regulatory protein